MDVEELLSRLIAQAVHAAPDPPGAMAMGDPLPMTLAAWSQGAQLYAGIGSFHRRISTHSADAQRFFDQGMRFLWVFNHDESTRSFARALKLDRSCAMCAWGVALTVGPNYNLPELVEARAKIAFEASRRIGSSLFGTCSAQRYGAPETQARPRASIATN